MKEGIEDSRLTLCSGTTDTGMSRLSLSDSDKAARDWFVEITRSLGCRISVDAMVPFTLIVVFYMVSISYHLFLNRVTSLQSELPKLLGRRRVLVLIWILSELDK